MLWHFKFCMNLPKIAGGSMPVGEFMGVENCKERKLKHCKPSGTN